MNSDATINNWPFYVPTNSISSSCTSKTVLLPPIILTPMAPNSNNNPSLPKNVLIPFQNKLDDSHILCNSPGATDSASKPKRGRKPCPNPTPQALRQRAYRLRKQHKKEQKLVSNVTKASHLSLSENEQLIAEILISMKNKSLLVN